MPLISKFDKRPLRVCLNVVSIEELENLKNIDRAIEKEEKIVFCPFFVSTDLFSPWMLLLNSLEIFFFVKCRHKRFPRIL